MKTIFWIILMVTASPLYLLAQRGQAATPPPMQNTNTGLISSNTRYGSKFAKTELTYEEALAEYQKMEGSPFLYDGEILVDMVYHNDSILKATTLLYDLYNEEIIVKKEDDKTIILDPIYYRGFTYVNKAGKTEIYKRVNPKDYLKFYHIIYENEDFTFCNEWVVSVLKNTRHVPGQDIPESKFNKRKVYYIMTDDKTTKVKLSNSTALEALPAKYQQQIPDLMKRLKIKKLKNEKHYIKLMNAF